MPPPSARAERSRIRESERDWGREDGDGGRPRRRRTGAHKPRRPAGSGPRPARRGTLSPFPAPCPCSGHACPPCYPRADGPLGPASPGAPAVAAVNGACRPRRPRPGPALPRASPSRPCPRPSPRRPGAPLARRPPPPGARTMLKSRLRMFLNELKLLVLTGGGRPRAEPQPRGGGGGGCGWAPFAGCSARDGDGDEEEYYGSEPRARGLAGDKEPRAGPPPPPAPPPPPPGALDALSLSSSLDSGLRTPQCRICFQGPEQVRLARAPGWAGRGGGAHLGCPRRPEQGAGPGAAGRDPGPRVGVG